MKAQNTKNQTVTISAYVKANYSPKAMQLWYGKKSFEFIPKSQCRVVGVMNYEEQKPDEIQSAYIEVPVWLYKRLKGTAYYGVC